MIITLTFNECEHEGDLDTYVWEVVNSGGQVVEKRWDPKRRKGMVEITVNNERDFESFMDKFKSKSSHSFLCKEK